MFLRASVARLEQLAVVQSQSPTLALASQEGVRMHSGGIERRKALSVALRISGDPAVWESCRRWDRR
jgi:hypothetical protein